MRRYDFFQAHWGCSRREYANVSSDGAMAHRISLFRDCLASNLGDKLQASCDAVYTVNRPEKGAASGCAEDWIPGYWPWQLRHCLRRCLRLQRAPARHTCSRIRRLVKLSGRLPSATASRSLVIRTKAGILEQVSLEPFARISLASVEFVDNGRPIRPHFRHLAYLQRLPGIFSSFQGGPVLHIRQPGSATQTGP